MILHVFDMAGVASLTAKLCNQAKMPSICCYRPKDDPYQISAFYRSSRISNNPAKMLIQLLVLLLQLKPRIVVIHYHQIILFLRLFTTLCRLNITYIMQYHGSDIRIHGKKWFVELLAHRFIFVTTDIIDGKLENGTLLENPVDQDLFYPTGLADSQALFIVPKLNADCSYLSACDYAFLYNIPLTIVENPIPYQDLKYYFHRHHWYFDMKGLAPQLSKTALEALACKCSVLQEDGRWIYPYQIDNDAKIKRIVKYYEQLY
jgi:hypothetical protein